MFVVIGTTTADIFVRGMPTFAGLGDGFQANNLVFCDKPLLIIVGGNGANSAYVLGRLDVETALCSTIGQDELGDWLAQKLLTQNVRLEGLLRHPNRATSSSTILLDNAENQSVFHHLGASETLALTPIHESLLARAAVLLCSSYTLLPHMRSGGFSRALRLAHEAGGITALDIGPAIGEPVTTSEIKSLFPQLDYLIANTHELKECTQAKDWEDACAKLLGEGCACVVAKRGGEGVSLRSHHGNIDLPAIQVSGNISVGAGDSFNAGFLYACWKKRSPQQALQFGSVVAAAVVAGQQGVFSAPSLAEVEAALEQK
ncbi:carbohydrate kinase family protein [Candidatus Leptofilum sp.]|uniref:carbohydrate kinase family protein n=1 Tax=Candidatus Leptofilum sp. TaxID=3241576 RepID=UPI003B5CAB43